jgi:lipoprotein-anchoring transpeptidase ErfK/SrfK
LKIVLPPSWRPSTSLPEEHSTLRSSKLSRRGRRLLLLGAALAVFGGGWLLVCWPAAAPPPAGPVQTASEQKLRALEAANQRLRKKIVELAPSGTYIVVDTAGNRVYLRKGEQTLREMLASCGSGNILREPGGDRTWTFDTPRGAFRVQSKISKPVWIKPDWAFIELGEPIPANAALRAEPGVMGDYAIGIGRGYFIHGTLYKRLLGRNVSHGCVRLGDDDLKDLYQTTALGTRVIIF